MPIYIGYSPYQVRHLLMGLSKLGFVYFDDETDLDHPAAETV